MLPAGAPYLQPTDERRRSGSHYTPRELTAPIVTHALRPGLRRGWARAPRPTRCCASRSAIRPADRGPSWSRRAASWATGSSRPGRGTPTYRPAFRPTRPRRSTPAASSRSAASTGSTRTRWRWIWPSCPSGSPRWPNDHEFTFLDHAVKAGDSLVGLTDAQIETMSWDRATPGLPCSSKIVRDRLREAREGRRDDPHRRATTWRSPCRRSAARGRGQARGPCALRGRRGGGDVLRRRQGQGPHRGARRSFHERFDSPPAEGDGYDHARALASRPARRRHDAVPLGARVPRGVRGRRRLRRHRRQPALRGQEHDLGRERAALHPLASGAACGHARQRRPRGAFLPAGLRAAARRWARSG